MIYFCFDHIIESDKQKFQKKFQDQINDEDQVLHTFRELVLGAFLSSRGFNVRHELEIESQTPDWTILDANNTSVTSIVELMSFHIDKTTRMEFEKQMKSKGFGSFWRDEKKDNIERLYQGIWQKASKYKQLANSLEIPYIIGVFPEFEIVIDQGELTDCLMNEEYGLFYIYPKVSGVLFFRESSGSYNFTLLENEKSKCGFGIGKGSLIFGAS